MSDKETNERIEKKVYQLRIEREALDSANKWDKRLSISHQGFEAGYIAGATSERPKAWNESIDACINIVFQEDGDFQQFISPKVVLEQLESLKHKQP